MGAGTVRSASRRRLAGEVTIDAVHAMSAIGQSSESVRDHKKAQQTEYARQLQMQMQQQAQSVSDDPRGDTRSRSSRRGSSGSGTGGGAGYGYGTPSGEGAVSSFGADPAAEGARKREMQHKYMHQLQEQQRGQVEAPGSTRAAPRHLVVR